jgi:DNA invertase Pin-like site-specific DNA recombinase
VSQGVASQRSAIERYAEMSGEPVTLWFSEKKSAKTLARPELERLLAAVKMRTVRKIVTFKLDRVCRSGVSDTFKVVSEIRSAGCELVCVADNLIIGNKDDVASDALLFALGLAAKLERLAGEERRAAARERLRAAGRPWGRPPRMDAGEVARAVEMKAEGRSLRAIAVALKTPRATVARTLERERVSRKSGAKPRPRPAGAAPEQQGAGRK